MWQSQICKSGIFAAIIFMLLLTPLDVPVSAYATEIDTYYRPPGSDPYPMQMTTLVLEGNWSEIGMQYGELRGAHIRLMYDITYEKWNGWGLNDGHLKSAINRYVNETEKLSPEMLELIEGISIGASEEFAKSQYDENLTDFEKVVLINIRPEILWSKEWHQTYEEGRQDVNGNITNNMIPGDACTAWAAFGNATKNGDTIVGTNLDLNVWPNMYQIAMIVIPSDPDANAFFVTMPEGAIGYNFEVNDKGLYLGATKVGGDYNPERGICEVDFGVPTVILCCYVIAYADNAEEAASIITVGTKKYRDQTGRKTMACTQGMNYILADDDSAIVVERTAHHYATRVPGDAGELGDYIVLTNHMLCNYSYNESNARTDEPMTNFGRSGNKYPSSKHRFWSAMWQIRNNYGYVDTTFGMCNISSLKYYYTENGTPIYEVKNETGVKVPAYLEGLTIARYLYTQGNLTLGTISAHVGNLNSLDICYTQGIPTLWKGPWDSANLATKSFMVAPAPTSTPPTPGFEAIFAIAGLIAVTRLLRKKRRY